MPEFSSILRCTAGYAYSNNNFVIQNAPEGDCSPDLLPAILVLRNILLRGNPTRLSRFLQAQIGDTYQQGSGNCYPLIGKATPVWHHTIRGDDEGNYNPARRFFEETLGKFLDEFSFVTQLIIPEAPINWITQVDADDFLDQQVDFYLPQAFLAIEIDGRQHDAQADYTRDKYLQDHGIQTVRIRTTDLEAQNGSFLDSMAAIKARIRKGMISQEERRQKEPNSITLSDYYDAYRFGIDLNDPNYVATAVVRFQVTIIELLRRGVLKPDTFWRIAVRCEEARYPLELAIEDNMLWLSHLLKLHKVEFKAPKVELIYIDSWENEKCDDDWIKIDFSLCSRYTDDNSYAPDVIFVRTDYYESYRYFRKSNSRDLEFVELRPFDYRTISTTAPIPYCLRFGGDDRDEESLLFIAANVFLINVESPSFNEGQLPIIRSCLSLQDTIGLLPTGGGKSLCFQLSVMLQPCLSFVVVPIKALMKDQVADLGYIGIDCVGAISSDDRPETRELSLKDFSKGKFLFFYVSPERFQSKAFRESFSIALKSFKTGYAVIDEIHCLSEWGHDFRTSYLNLSKTIRRMSPGIPFIGLTATASLNVLKDIQLELGVDDENVVTLLNYTRDELEFEIFNQTKNGLVELKKLIKAIDDSCSILNPCNDDQNCLLVFTQTVNGAKGCRYIAGELGKHFSTEVEYFCGSPPLDAKFENNSFDEYKRMVQEKFKSNAIRMIVATKAFGMGINKPNIAATIHFGMPSSMESFYQEGGRAGRDKAKYRVQKAKCFLLFAPPPRNDNLDAIWDRKCSLGQLKDICSTNKYSSDLSTGLFFLTKGLLEVDSEADLILSILNTLPKEGGIVTLSGEDYDVDHGSIDAADVNDKNGTASKAELEKAIYRLSQLGVVEDWTIEDYFNGGQIEVSVLPINLESMITALEKTIRKYNHAWTMSETERPQNEHQCIEMLLNWVNDYFVYNRRQSLKNIHDLCMGAVDDRISSQEIKQRLEAYFKFTRSTSILQHIVEHPMDYTCWLDVLRMHTSDLGGNDPQDNSLRNLVSSLSRFLESFRDNVGLDFLSGATRLLMNEFDDADGRPRMKSAMETIAAYDRKTAIDILEAITAFFLGQCVSCRNEMSAMLQETIPWIEPRWIYSHLDDDHSLYLCLKESAARLKNIKETLYAGS